MAGLWLVYGRFGSIVDGLLVLWVVCGWFGYFVSRLWVTNKTNELVFTMENNLHIQNLSSKAGI